jgi:LDH2 family malate/lactate/ureidoglycolate dehydrogenase
MTDTIKIDADRLRAFGTAVYETIGVPADRAALVADTLVQADLWGHQSHGVMRMPWYAARVRSGACNAAATPTFEVDSGAIAVIDGHDGLGQAISAYAMGEAIRRAKTFGMCAIAVRNSGHFGTAMYYTLMAAREGCIGFLTTNTSPAMAPWGGRRKGVGNNPWSWASPGGNHPPMVLDIANTAVARGKIYLANKRGESIPNTWALNEQGVPTTDPAEAVKGMIQPMGQHKGYAISVAMDMLAAVLSGSPFGTQVVGPMMPEGRSGAGHFMIVLNIAAFQPLESFGKRMDDYIAQLKATPLAEGASEILYPGEMEARNDKRHRAEGVQIPKDTTDDLRKLAGELNLQAHLPF